MRRVIGASTVGAFVAMMSLLACDRPQNGQNSPVAQFGGIDAGFGSPNPMPGSPIADAGFAPVNPSPGTPGSPSNPGNPGSPSPTAPTPPTPSPTTP
jgi:hypothetical protein